VLGIQGPGWLPFLLSLIPVALTLFSSPGEPFTRTERIVASGAAGLAVLIGLTKVLFPPAYATGRGVGLWLSLLSGGALLAAGASRARAAPARPMPLRRSARASGKGSPGSPAASAAAG